jgi:glucuronate isomerase
MQKKYIHKDYFLHSSLAEELYHNIAAKHSIIDYHNHLRPEYLATNRKFENTADAWVVSDPYKHRAMRISGVPENGITGPASYEQKFMYWAATVPKTLGNPLFMWTALELKRIFGIEEFLSEKNAVDIWKTCNAQLENDDYGAVGILRKFDVEILCTSDDLLDDLGHHVNATSKQGIEVFPSLRGDSILAIDSPVFKTWFEKLQSLSSQQINDFDSYLSAIIEKLDAFTKAGCRLADHSLDGGFVFENSGRKAAAGIFLKWVSGKDLSRTEINGFKNYLLHFLGKEYAQRGWVLQLHIGAQRLTSSRLRKLAGPTGGFATIGNSCDISGLCSYLDSLESENKLPKIILYTLNPADNEAFSVLTGSFSEDGVSGKIQFGPGWWYNDQYEGISKQLTDLASYGLLSQFIGMTTDSRSVFSFSRHEYFRRILCNKIATWVNEGNLPNDLPVLSKLVSNIVYFNSKDWIIKN